MRAELLRVHRSEAGVVPVLAILAVAGIGVVVDQLVLGGDATALLFDAFFRAVQALADAVFAAIGGAIELLPDAADLDLAIPTGIIQGYALLNTFLPLAEALTMAGVVVAAHLALFGWRLAVMIYHLLPKPLMGT